ncbi:MAG TPA: RNB domain-containing ribonuclease [Jiangellales bacterium]|nr:RNB domain-containing ribonuclease [Jiangellales bacterium]
MPRRQLRLAGPDGIADHLRDLREELEVPAGFPVQVLEEAGEGSREPRLPTTDLTGLDFVTLDPPGSRDLDQAVHIERRGAGWRVHYAIADVAAFVRPGGALDAEVHGRGLTLYGPDTRTPLHPTVLSEGAASLLPGEDRPALVWRFDLDSDAEPVSVGLRRAVVRSRAQLDYPAVQADLDAGRGSSGELLQEVGTLRLERERDRGGVSLPVPEQVAVHGDDGWRLEYRAPQPVEAWNAQISLLTGMAAARIMLDGGIGVLRTLPEADPRDLARLRRVARALGVEWPEEVAYPDFVRGLDAATPAHAAVIDAATTLLRGAGYEAFDGSAPEAGFAGGRVRHAAIAAPYAHATAPLRRLVDRFVGEACVSLVAGADVPDWVLAALPALPDEMGAAVRRAGGYERACLDLVEAALLEPRVGESFGGVVVDVDGERGRGEVHLHEPAVRARVDGEALPLGERVEVRLAEASVAERRLRFVHPA